MTPPPQQSETREVSLSRAEQWLVHHVLSTRADEALDDEKKPPRWLLGVFDAIESGTETLTLHQARKLLDLLRTYADGEETPSEDVAAATAIIERLDEVIET